MLRLSWTVQTLEDWKKKFKEKTGKKVIIQVFPKDEVPPIYSTNKDCIIIHYW